MKPINVQLYVLKANTKCNLAPSEHVIPEGTEILRVTFNGFGLRNHIHVCKEHAASLKDTITELLG